MVGQSRFDTFRHEQHLIFVTVEVLRQFTLLDATIHADLSEALSRRVRVFYDTGESHQCPHVGVTLLGDVSVERLFVAHGVEPPFCHHHRFSAAADLVFHMRAEVFDDHFCFRTQVYRVES